MLVETYSEPLRGLGLREQGCCSVVMGDERIEDPRPRSRPWAAHCLRVPAMATGVVRVYGGHRSYPIQPGQERKI